MATNYACIGCAHWYWVTGGSSHQCQHVSGYSTTLIYSDHDLYRNRSNEWWSEEYESGCGGTEDTEVVQTFCFVALFPSLMSFSDLLSDQCQWSWHRMWPPESGDGAFPCARSPQRSLLRWNNRLWDLWVCTIAYVGRLFHCLFPNSSLL